MRQYSPGSPIRVQADDAGAPTSFIWQGQRHLVNAIEDIREPHLGWWQAGGEVHRIYYLVTTTRGLITEIYRDCLADAWYVARVWD